MNTLFQYFFDNHEHPFREEKIFITRRDGHLLFTNQKNMDAHSAGALISGVWQAAHALGHYIPGFKMDDYYRLSFDTSSKGLYIFPFLVQKDDYYFGITYSGKVNPGQLKMQVQNLASKLETFAQNNMKKFKTKDREGFLFKEITDAEMDRLFSIQSQRT
ncbi:MAG: hypothetical protein JNM93_10030 [Bacteriovoracaceae bacterium]|nr:hypothetical protein [Bacteriovoracaceae bacterium]